ncbi:hypothetical protein K501DRAFT_272333 [Backusella circina FSU 941]|nr:hypothetical protein K501DRAFT_272333 [Backusella circina FSU 941]
MKSAFILIAVLCFVASCLAACNCDADDSVCYSKCVTEANSCVRSCKDNTNCYENCINDHWPAASAAALPSFKAVLASASEDAVATASPTAALESAASSGVPKASASAGQKDVSSTGQVSLALSLGASASIPVSLIFASLVYIAF